MAWSTKSGAAGRSLPSVVAVVMMVLAGWVAAPARLDAQSDGSSYGARVIQVWKGRRQLELRDGEAVIATFPVALGLDPRLGKRLQGDNRTPEGHYFVSEKKPESRFHRFLGLNYPNIDDADRGYTDRLIDAAQWASIFLANVRGAPPPWYTVLGGRVGIHGFGGRPFAEVDWTEGCIAVSDADIDYIYDRVSVGTPVIINE